MTGPITSASIPYALKQGVKRPTTPAKPAKQAPAHKAAAKMATKYNRGK